jgi:hypothetical protein
MHQISQDTLTISSVVDLTPLYPPAWKPAFLTTLRKWYITTYQDQFFVSPPKWFGAYIWMEAIYHLPLSVWVLGGLVRGECVSAWLISFQGEGVVDVQEGEQGSRYKCFLPMCFQAFTYCKEWYSLCRFSCYFRSPVCFCLYPPLITPDDPLVPVHLLIYAVQTAMTTLTCIVDYMSWNVDVKVKMDLGALYGPYLLVCELFRPCDGIRLGGSRVRGKADRL